MSGNSSRGEISTVPGNQAGFLEVVALQADLDPSLGSQNLSISAEWQSK